MRMYYCSDKVKRSGQESIAARGRRLYTPPPNVVPASSQRARSVEPAGLRHPLGRRVAIMQPDSRIESESLSPTAAIHRSLGRYRGQPLGIRGFVLARHLLAPLARVAAAVPPTG